jgi:ATP-binding cassette subfamily B protein
MPDSDDCPGSEGAERGWTLAQLPAEVRAGADGQLDGQTIVSWSEFDLDERNHYCRRFAVLTESRLIILANGQRSVLAIKDIDEVKIVEQLGLDRMVVIVGGKVAAELRYTRRHRRSMSRLERKLQRRLPRKDSDSEPPPPDWLEVVEREAEKKELCPKCGQVIPSYAEGVCPQCLHNRRILWRLMGVARPYRPQLIVALLLTLLVAALTATLPALNKQLIDDAVIPLNLSRLWLWVGTIAAVVLVNEAVSGVRMYILARVGTSITADLRHMVYAHLHELSLRYFGKRRTGSLITRVTSDTDRLWDFIAFGSINLVRDIAMIGMTAGVMFYLNWKLALIALLPLPALGVVTYFRGMKMQRLWGRLWTYWSRITAVVGDALPGVRVVKAFANEKREIARFDARSNEYTFKEQEIHKVWTTLGPIVSAMMRMGGLLVWLAGGYIIIRWPEKDPTGQIINPGNTVGVLVAFTQSLWMFYQPIMELANSSRMITRAASSAQRVFEVLDTQPDIYSRDHPVIKERLEGRVEFKQVSFSYEGAQPALREVSLVAEPGQMIGLCGPSGAGKSTLVNLICRFYDVTDGQILIDGVDIRDYDVKWLRRQVGIVLQEPYLFHGTIADNIRYGNPTASDAEVIRAAKAANAHDFIVGFPDGYDTMVGERGQSLSGGERQRVSIARAILHNPRILILDEATNSVDSETEMQIQQALDRLVAGRTTFAIAHRLSTLQSADRLIVLEKGRIVEQGLHAELVDKEGGVYARLHKTQMEMNAQVAIR